MADLNTDDTVLAGFLEDESGYRGHADAVIRAKDTHQVAEALAEASQAGVAVTFSARRTSLTGAAIPEGGWIVAVDEQSDPALVEVDLEREEATAPAGVLMVDVERAVEAKGLFLPPDPTSRKECSIGGAVACNASGARSFGYGPMGEWVAGLEVVLATGDPRCTLAGAELEVHALVDGSPDAAGQVQRAAQALGVAEVVRERIASVAVRVHRWDGGAASLPLAAPAALAVTRAELER